MKGKKVAVLKVWKISPLQRKKLLERHWQKFEPDRSVKTHNTAPGKML